MAQPLDGKVGVCLTETFSQGEVTLQKWETLLSGLYISALLLHFQKYLLASSHWPEPRLTQNFTRCPLRPLPLFLGSQTGF